jgi:hypothetical protein
MTSVQVKDSQVLQIALMLLLLIGFFGLFAGLVLFVEGVIAPDSTS